LESTGLTWTKTSAQKVSFVARQLLAKPQQCKNRLPSASSRRRAERAAADTPRTTHVGVATDGERIVQLNRRTRWTEPRPDFAAWSARLGPPSLLERASLLAAARA
jgi:hypothetical protein